MILGLLAMGAAMTAPRFELLKWNHTPSMSPGLYLRSMDNPAVGRIVAITPPLAAVSYAQRRGMNLDGMTLLKPLAAGPGDHVCVTDELRINGAHVAPVHRTGADGSPMPVWNGCRDLGADEWFTYAPRIWNSFDGRYYGPVHTESLVGVFKPVWVWD